MEDIITSLKIKNELMEAYIAGEDVNRLLEIAYEYLDKSITVFDCSSRIVAMVGQDKVKASDFAPGLYIIDHGYSTGQRNNLDDFEEMTQWVIDSANPRVNNKWGVPRMNCRIMVNGDFAGHITIQAVDTPFSDLDFEVESLLRTLIEKIWNKEKLDYRNKSAVFLKNVYDGIYVNREDALLAEMKYANITKSNIYAALFIQQRKVDNSSLPMKVLMSHFSTYFYGKTEIEVSYYIADDCGICLLSTKEDRIKKEVADVIAEFCKSNSCYGGLSGTFDNLNDFRDYCNQAEHLAKTINENKDICLANFVNSYWQYIVYCLEQSVKMETLICAPVYKIFMYDKENHTNLIDSYIAYIECGSNITLAANKLYIHRNTMNKRIRQLSDILECNVDSIPNDSSLLISAKIAKLVNEKEEKESNNYKH